MTAWIYATNSWGTAVKFLLWLQTFLRALNPPLLLCSRRLSSDRRSGLCWGLGLDRLPTILVMPFAFRMPTFPRFRAQRRSGTLDNS